MIPEKHQKEILYCKNKNAKRIRRTSEQKLSTYTTEPKKKYYKIYPTLNLCRLSTTYKNRRNINNFTVFFFCFRDFFFFFLVLVCLGSNGYNSFAFVLIQYKQKKRSKSKKKTKNKICEIVRNLMLLYL